MNFSDILRFFDNETLPLTSEQKFCLLSQETSFVTYTCDFAAVCPRLFCDRSHLLIAVAFPLLAWDSNPLWLRSSQVLVRTLNRTHPTHRLCLTWLRYSESNRDITESKSVGLPFAYTPLMHQRASLGSTDNT